MDEEFELPVKYNNKEMLLPARFERTGYSYRILVQINGQVFHFEPDEERNWRALLNLEDPGQQKVDASLLQSVAEALSELG